MGNKDIIDELKALEAALENTLNPAKTIKALNPANDFLDITERMNDIYVKSAEADLRLMKLATDLQIDQAKKMAELALEQNKKMTEMKKAPL